LFRPGRFFIETRFLFSFIGLTNARRSPLFLPGRFFIETRFLFSSCLSPEIKQLHQQSVFYSRKTGNCQLTVDNKAIFSKPKSPGCRANIAVPGNLSYNLLYRQRLVPVPSAENQNSMRSLFSNYPKFGYHPLIELPVQQNNLP